MKRLIGSSWRVVLVGVVLAACAQRPPRTDGPAPPDAGPTTLVVENQSTFQMRIYAIWSSQEVRIGTVNGLARDRLTVPEYLVAGGRSLRFRAVPVSGLGSATTFEMYVGPGDSVRLVIPSQLR